MDWGTKQRHPTYRDPVLPAFYNRCQSREEHSPGHSTERPLRHRSVAGAVQEGKSIGRRKGELQTLGGLGVQAVGQSTPPGSQAAPDHHAGATESGPG